MKILHITSSPSGQQSVSYRMSQRVMDRLLSQHPAAQIVTRDLWSEPLPHVDGEYAAALGGARDGAPTAANARGVSSLALSDRLIAELRDSDSVIIATPMRTTWSSQAFSAEGT